jgi:hypothetical protein
MSTFGAKADISLPTFMSRTTVVIKKVLFKNGSIATNRPKALSIFVCYFEPQMTYI